MIYKELKMKNNSAQIGRMVFLCLFFIFSTLGFSQTKPVVHSEVDTTYIRIGEQIQFKVSVEVDSTSQVFFPEGQTFSPLETVEAFKTDTTRKNDRFTLQKIYALTQFDSGSYKLPAQRIEIDGIGYFTDSLRVNVETVPVDTVAQKMFDIKPLIQVEKSSSKLWMILLLILLGLLIVAGLLYWFVFRKKPLTEEEKEALLPPYDRALIELKRLENSKYLIQDEYKQYYSELTDIVRSYLEEDAHVSALESTTDELIDKLEMLKDAGELTLEEETIQQFKRILQTADLVKFAKSKPPTSVAEEDRKSIEQIVIKTHDALPEPTLEELMEQAEYQEELERKKQKKKLVIAIASFAGFLLLSAVAVTAYYGYEYTKDTVLQHPTKKLLEGEWVSSSYGFPPIDLETPDVLIRQELKLTPEMQATIKELQVFTYQSENEALNIGTISSIFADPKKAAEFEKSIESYLINLEKKGVKNIITKQEEYTTISGVKGVKTYGSGKFPLEGSDEFVKGKYMMLLFGGDGFQQQVMISWLEDDSYAQEIVDKILATLEVKTLVI